MCKKAVDTYLSAMQFVPDQDKTQEMCDKATDACLPALKFVPNWFVTNKMLEKWGYLDTFSFFII